MRKHYVLIDFENLQPTDLELLQNEIFILRVFLGATQTKIPVEMACAIQKMGARAEYIRLAVSGNNALDFHLCFYLGRLVESDPKGAFFILSKDTGFDWLVSHLKTQKIFCKRIESLTELPSTKPQERLMAIVTRLQQPKPPKPASRQTMGNAIQALFGKQLTDDEVEGLIQQLMKRGWVTENNGKLSYALPAPE